MMENYRWYLVTHRWNARSYNKMVMHVECYNVVSACHHCCHENATIRSLFFVYLAVAVQCCYGHAATCSLSTSVELQNILYCYPQYKNITLEQATKPQRGSRRIAVPFL